MRSSFVSIGVIDAGASSGADDTNLGPAAAGTAGTAGTARWPAGIRKPIATPSAITKRKDFSIEARNYARVVKGRLLRHPGEGRDLSENGHRCRYRRRPNS